MNDNNLKNIDELLKRVKQKADEIGMTSGDMFIILTLEILRGELTSKEEITELTISACREITSTTSHFYYYRDYPDLYKYLQEVFQEISKLDIRFFSADLTDFVGFEVKDWHNYINIATKNLLENLPAQYLYKKGNES